MPDDILRLGMCHWIGEVRGADDLPIIGTKRRCGSPTFWVFSLKKFPTMISFCESHSRIWLETHGTEGWLMCKFEGLLVASVLES